MAISIKKPFISSLVEGLIHPKVYQDVLKTYAKETLTFLDYGNISITNADEKTLSRVQFTECELSPFRKIEFDCDNLDVSSSQVLRAASTYRFSKKKVKFTDVKKLLVNSFSPDASARRPYPSAGGLYPIEPLVFLFNERLETDISISSACYHFRPVSKKLQMIKEISINTFFDKLLHGFVKHENYPCFCILYIAHIGKAIFKYRYRGYRHALMEVGSMYQQAMINSQQIGLNNTVWSTFGDHEILYALDLDFGTYMPLTMQLFGYGE